MCPSKSPQSWRLSVVSLAFLALALWVPGTLGDSHALELTKDNFDSTLAEHADAEWLVKFYAPWCGHCKRLAPIWDEAQGLVEQKGLNVKLAKVDCTKHSAICSRWKISSYPTLKWIRHGGKDVLEYRGGRTIETVMDYAQRVASPALTELKTTREVKDFLEQNPKAAYVYFRPEEGHTSDEAADATSDTLFEVVKSVADVHKDVTVVAVAPEHAADDLGIRITHNLKPLKEDETVGGRLVVFRRDEGKCYPAANNVTVEAVGFWVDGHRLETLPKITGQNYRDIGGRGKPTAIAVLRGARAKTTADEEGVETAAEDLPINKEFLSTVRGVAREMEDKFAFGYLDGKQWEKFAAQFGVSQRVLPRMVIVDSPTEWYLPFPVDVKGHRGSVEFLEKVHKGEIKMLRTWTSAVKYYSKDYWHVWAICLALAVFGPVLYMLVVEIRNDNKKAAEAAKKETAKTK